MYTKSALVLLAAAATANAFNYAHAGVQTLGKRDITQGWSVQSDSTPDGTTSCGKGAYCPSDLHCWAAKNAEVSACCTDSSDCTGAVEGAPVCADSSWNMFIGNDGNGFCCEVGLVGVVDTSAKTVACVASADVGSSTTALLTASGSGSAKTTSGSSSSATGSSTATTTSASSSASSSASTSSSTSTSASGSSSSSSSPGVAATKNSTSTGSSSTSSSTSSNASSVPTGAAGRNEYALGAIAAGFLLAAAL